MPGATLSFRLGGTGKRAAVGIDHYLRRRAGDEVGALPIGALRFGEGNVSAARYSEESDPIPRESSVGSSPKTSVRPSVTAA